MKPAKFRSCFFFRGCIAGFPYRSEFCLLIFDLFLGLDVFSVQCINPSHPLIAMEVFVDKVLIVKINAVICSTLAGGIGDARAAFYGSCDCGFAGAVIPEEEIDKSRLLDKLLCIFKGGIVQSDAPDMCWYLFSHRNSSQFGFGMSLSPALSKALNRSTL